MHALLLGDWLNLGVPVQRLIAIAIHCLVAVTAARYAFVSIPAVRTHRRTNGAESFSG